MAKGILGNPVFIGAATAAVTWYLLDEVLDDHIERLLGKKKNKKGGKKKMIRNHYGQIEIVDDYDDYDDYY